MFTWLLGRSFSLTLVIAMLSVSFHILTSEDHPKPLGEKQQEGMEAIHSLI